MADTTTVNIYAQLVTLYSGLVDVHHELRAFTRSSTHQAKIEQTSSKYEACIKHSLHEANIEQSEHTSCNKSGNVV